MRKGKIVYIQIITLLLFSIVSILFLPDTSSNLFQGLDSCNIYQENWKIEDEDNLQACDELPTFFYTQNNKQDIYIHKKLENITNGSCLGFFSFQQQIQVLLDGEVIYEFLPHKLYNSSTPGNKWNLIPLNENDNGKTISIHIYQCYSKNRVTIPTMYYGTQAGIILNYLSKELPQIFISLTAILVGILIGILCLVYRHKTNMARGLHWLALFAISRGIWGTIEGNTYSFFLPRLLLISQLSYLSLKFAVITYLYFFNYSFHDGKNKILRFLTLLSLLDFWGTFILQLLGIVDFANTVFLTHTILLCSGIYASADVFLSLYKQKNDSKLMLSYKRKNTYFAQMSGTFIIILTAIIDMFRYYTTNSPDVAKYSRIGDMIYIVSITFSLFLDFVYLIRMGHKAAIIREEASLDPMTKLYNRAHFEKEMRKKTKHYLIKHGIIILDLNNLKEFNDQQGHNAGDQYIVVASKFIHSVFSPYGNIYRIGGDEFCVITKNLSEQQFNELQLALEKEMTSQKMDNTPCMQISSGFALYNPATDTSLHDTMKRADEQMYIRKEHLKGEAGR